MYNFNKSLKLQIEHQPFARIKKKFIFTFFLEKQCNSFQIKPFFKCDFDKKSVINQMEPSHLGPMNTKQISVNFQINLVKSVRQYCSDDLPA